MRQVLLPLSERLWLAVQTVALAGPEKVIVKAVVVLPHNTGSSAFTACYILDSLNPEAITARIHESSQICTIKG